MEEIKNKLIDILSQITRIESPKPEASQDEVDCAQDCQERENVLELMSRNANLTRDIKHALAKIEKGTYGLCEVSGEEIPKERLEFIPWARHTTKIQGEIDKKVIAKPKYEYLELKDDEEEDPETE
jgi:DnaK suppressor protein